MNKHRLALRDGDDKTQMVLYFGNAAATQFYNSLEKNGVFADSRLAQCFAICGMRLEVKCCKRHVAVKLSDGRFSV